MTFKGSPIYLVHKLTSGRQMRRRVQLEALELVTRTFSADENYAAEESARNAALLHDQVQRTEQRRAAREAEATARAERLAEEHAADEAMAESITLESALAHRAKTLLQLEHDDRHVKLQVAIESIAPGMVGEITEDIERHLATFSVKAHMRHSVTVTREWLNLGNPDQIWPQLIRELQDQAIQKLGLEARIAERVTAEVNAFANRLDATLTAERDAASEKAARLDAGSLNRERMLGQMHGINRAIVALRVQ